MPSMYQRGIGSAFIERQQHACPAGVSKSLPGCPPCARKLTRSEYGGIHSHVLCNGHTSQALCQVLGYEDARGSKSATGTTFERAAQRFRHLHALMGIIVSCSGRHKYHRQRATQAWATIATPRIWAKHDGDKRVMPSLLHPSTCLYHRPRVRKGPMAWAKRAMGRKARWVSLGTSREQSMGRTPNVSRLFHYKCMLREPEKFQRRGAIKQLLFPVFSACPKRNLSEAK